MEDRNAMMSVLDKTYDLAKDGKGPVQGAQSLARNFEDTCSSREEDAYSLVRWQAAKTGGTGFFCGLGGLLTLPATIPADLANEIFIDVRMAASIADIAGYDLSNDKVRTFCYLALCGSKAKDVVKNVAAEVGKKVALQSIDNITGKTLTNINQKVGWRLVTKFGQTGTFNLGKAVPVVGGVINGGLNIWSTKTVGNQAVETFMGNAA